MNGIALIILLAILISFGVETLASVLNLKALHHPIPETLRDHVDAAAYTRHQAYTQTKTRAGLFHATFGLLVTLMFWFGGGFPWLDHWVAQWTENPIGGGVLFIALLILGKHLLDIPFDWYATFVIEAQFGFNRATPALFVKDHLQSLALTLALGGPLLALILWILESAGTWAWLMGWGTTTLFLLVLHYVAPTWIMPLFNTFKPLEEGPLKTAIQTFTTRVGFPLQEIHVMDGSRRSNKANAFFTGFGRKKRIVLFDTLVNQHTPDELVAVLAHEVGHYRHRHTMIQLGVAIVHMGVLFYLLAWALPHPALHAAFFMEHVTLHGGLVFFSLLLTPVELPLSMLLHALSRRFEFQADHFAARHLPDPAPLIAALRGLSLTTLSNLTPHPLHILLNYSHPPVDQRIRAITAWADSQDMTQT